MSDEGQEWMLLPLEEKIARRQGIPFKVPVPKEEFEGLADSGLSADKLSGWIKDFLENAPVAKDGNWRRRNSEIVSQLEGFIDKQPLWDKAQKLFGENQFDKALKTLKRITIMMPDDHAAKMNYANALANQGDIDKAFKTLRQIRDTFQGEPDFHVTVAQLQVAKGDNDAAIAELVTALEAQPDHLGAMDALAKLGVLAKIYENPKDATSLTFVRADSLLDYLKEQWDAGDMSHEAYLDQLGYHMAEMRYDVALEAAERAEKVSEDGDDRALLGRVRCLRELGRHEEAAAALEPRIAAAPSAALYVELCACHKAAGKLDDAVAAVDKALELDPGDQEAICLKLWPTDRGDMQKVQEVMASLQKWADDHADVAGAWRSLARAKLVLGSDDEALELFEKAVGLAPDDDDLRSEWWGELARTTQYQRIIDDSEKLGDMGARAWQLRWNEAEAYRGLKRLMEARGCYMQLNSDESLHVDIRKRAKRAAMELGAADVGGGAPPAEG